MAADWKRTAAGVLARAERTLGRTAAVVDPREIRNFLVLQCESPLGSVVHATPLYRALKLAVPEARVTVAASSMAADVLRNCLSIDTCVEIPSPAVHFVAATKATRKLRWSMGPDPLCVLTTVGNSRPRVSLLAASLGRAWRAGYTLYPELYDLPLRFTPERGQIEANLDIVRALGHAAPSLEPHIYFKRQDQQYAADLLRPASDSLRVAFVIRNSGGQRNQWSTDRFREVAANLWRVHRAAPIFLGTAADASDIDAFRQTLPDPGISAAGLTTVPQLAALLAQCDLVVSLDTGTFHVARAVQLPGIVIAPAWQSPLEWLPIANARYRVLRGPSLPEAPVDYWIEEVATEQVIGAASELLRDFPVSAGAREARVSRSCI